MTCTGGSPPHQKTFRQRDSRRWSTAFFAKTSLPPNVTLTSYETILLDDERNQAILRILDGVQVDDDHLAFEVIADLASADTVMGHDHTLRYLRSDEVWEPRLAQRSGLVGGAALPESSVDRARARAQDLLRTYRVPRLAASVQSEIDGVLASYDMAQ